MKTKEVIRRYKTAFIEKKGKKTDIRLKLLILFLRKLTTIDKYLKILDKRIYINS
ncbi:hypothetical protein FUMI01_29670 [Flavobacterium sp. UMI-01]|nr:hypothetical protein FUMI01_29670 [Flavobacterium sp. UMI-01]